MGKTKDAVLNNDGTCTFFFKDDACGENGQFDPGANEVGLTIDGMGNASLLLSQHFFSVLNKNGIPTHFISADLGQRTMTCRHLNMLPVEFIWRSKAWGSFCKVYGVEQGYPLNGLIEATLKSDALGDPRINKDACVALGKVTAEQYEQCKHLIQRLGEILQSELNQYGYELIDFKAEFGTDMEGHVLVADEISGGIWRILDGTGKPVDPIECARKICREHYQTS